MVVIDAFPFFNELELLEIRLNELSDVVDYFVLVEATLTHSGKQKPLYYNNNKHLFEKFSSKILHIIVQDMPTKPEEIQAAISPQDRRWLATGYQLGDDWVRERFQRNAMMRGLTSCYPDDIIIIEDADEMVRKEIIERLDKTMCEGSNAVQQTLHTCYLNWKCTNMPWSGSKILRYKYVTNPSEHRFHTEATCSIKDGGWHYNYLGGSDKIKQKIWAYAHQEFNVPSILENIERNLQLKQDVLGRQYKYEKIDLDYNNTPKYIVDNLDKFDYLLYHGE